MQPVSSTRVMSPASSSSRDMMTASLSLTASALVLVVTPGRDDVIVETVGGLMGVGGMTTTLISPSSKISPEMNERVNKKSAIQREYIFNYKSLGHYANTRFTFYFHERKRTLTILSFVL